MPYSTYDLDIIVVLRSEADFHALYQYFREKGNKVEDVYIYIGSMPVQFLPNYISPLFTETVEQAHEVIIEGIPSKVASIEHIIVLALDVFRAKDKIRIVQLLEEADRDLLDEILGRFDDEEGKLRARFKQVLANI